MLNLLSRIPPAHLGQHLRGLEAVTQPSLRQTGTGCVDNLRKDPNKLVSLQGSPRLSSHSWLEAPQFAWTLERCCEAEARFGASDTPLA